MHWQDFSKHLTEQLNQDIVIQNTRSVAGGDIHQAYQLQTHNESFFLKLNEAASSPLFTTEAHNLQAIASSDSIKCPAVFAHGVFQNQAWLLMEYLPLTSKGDDVQRGRDLALMHQQINKTSQPFGWFEDNFIGRSLQKNQWHFSWVDFYAQQRLLPQLELSQLHGGTRELYDVGLELIAALPYWFQDYQPSASLLHGDLWGGNSAFVNNNVDNNKNNKAIIYDPASYYGDRETDIAMTELFGGFSQAFYQSYESVWPLDKGYQSRKPLYNLYHILNHFNLFGGHYQNQALNSMQQLLKQAK